VATRLGKAFRAENQERDNSDHKRLRCADAEEGRQHKLRECTRSASEPRAEDNQAHRGAQSGRRTRPDLDCGCFCARARGRRASCAPRCTTRCARLLATASLAGGVRRRQPRTATAVHDWTL
jgi:hypothetical protein